MAEVLTSPLPPRVVAAMRQLDAALDLLNNAARELAQPTFAPAWADHTRDYPTACEHLRTAQHAVRDAYRALGAGPERSE